MIEIDQETQEQILSAFATATEIVLRELARTEDAVVSAERRPDHQWIGDIAAIIDLTSANLDELILSMPVAVAETLARRILAETPATVDTDMIRDCVGETANGIAGQAKALLHGTPSRIAFSVPRIILPDSEEAGHRTNGDCLVLSCVCDVGEFAVQVRLRK
jgi:CheY-specific phosphatase CheX